MINGKELRLGNLLYAKNNEITEVTDIISSLDFNRTIFWCFGYSESQVKPIRLTEELHGKFGVKVNGFGNFEYEIDNNRLIVFTRDYIFLRQSDISNKRHEGKIVALWNKDFKRRDIYVHEFQNLYFALTGEELKMLNESLT